MSYMKYKTLPKFSKHQLFLLDKLSWNKWEVYQSQKLEGIIWKWIKLQGTATKFSLENVEKIEDANYNTSSQSKIWLHQVIQTSSQPACIMVLSV